jgi:two-component system chemotaxis response regulator CheY
MVFLLVEDSRPTRNLLKNYLTDIDIGYSRRTFVEADSGESALIKLRSQRIDFVFLDWNLTTKMTGLDVLKELRADEKFKSMPIIMVSSESDKINVIGALKNGANDFIVKPIDKKSFSEKVLKVIANNLA